MLGILPATGTASAQTALQLPEILVTTPSPVSAEQIGGLLPGGLIVVPGAFVPVTVVPERDIEMSTASNLGDLLFTRPGISASTFAPGAASRPIIRGLDNYRVRIQENGIGTHDLSTLGDDHAVPLDPLAIEQVEVIRGPATLRWGSQVIGGVVSAINNRIPTILVPGVRGELRGALSSVDDGREAAAVLDAAHGNFALHADGFWRKSEDYRIPGGKQENTAARSHGGALGGSWFFDGGFVGLSLAHIDSLYHVPGEHADDNTRIDLEQTKLHLKGEFTPGGLLVDKVRFWFGSTNYFHKEIEDDAGVPEVHATFKNREKEGHVEVQRLSNTSAWGGHSGAFGVQLGLQNVSTGAHAEELLAPAESRRVAGYVFEELRMAGGRRVQVAGRVEHVKVDGTAAFFPNGDPQNGFIWTGPADDPVEFDSAPGFTPVSASIGFLQDWPNGVVASLTLQHVERSPEITELFSKGAHHASHTFEIGNPNLKIERAQSVEIGLKKAEGPLRFDATAYYTRYRNFIYRHETGVVCDEDFDTCGNGGTELHQIFYAQRAARLFGAEVAAQLDVAPLAGGWWGVNGQYDFVNAKFSDGSYVPRIPPHRLGGGLFWRNDNWFARVSLLHAFAQDRVSGEEAPTPGYNVLRAELSYRHDLPDGRSVTLGVTGDNLLNERMRNHAAFNKDDVLLPGRNIRGFAKLAF